MKPTFTRRYRRRTTPAKSEGNFFKKDAQETFFGQPAQENFFQPTVALATTQGVQRKCDDCEKEDKKVQRAEDKKEEDKVMRAEDKKEEEVQRHTDNKEEDKVMRAENEKEEEKVQKKEANSTSAVTTKSVSSYISSLNGKGQLLSPKANHFFSARMGHDFSNVKIHRDKQAADSAKAINAKAYTVGNNIVFNDGQYNIESGEGKKLMAHELTHVMQQNLSAVQRAPAPMTTQAKQPTAADKTEFIKDTIHFFEKATFYYSKPKNPMDAAIFDRVIQAWYSMIIDGEKMIATELNNDALLLRSLQTAYRAAVSALISRASAALNVKEGDLFNQNNGRIPIWAWQTPHHMEIGITTPIPEGQSINISSNAVEFNFANVNVQILQDGVNGSLSVDKPAATKVDIIPGLLHLSNPVNGIVANVRGPGITTATIQTFYRTLGDRTKTSGYGRGTTAEDIKGGTVDSRSKTVGFHEGNHGLDYMEFFNTHPFPGITITPPLQHSDLLLLIQRWKDAMKQYVSDMEKFTNKRTHCVGKTIDQFNQEHSPGARITRECP